MKFCCKKIYKCVSFQSYVKPISQTDRRVRAITTDASDNHQTSHILSKVQDNLSGFPQNQQVHQQIVTWPVPPQSQWKMQQQGAVSSPEVPQTQTEMMPQVVATRPEKPQSQLKVSQQQVATPPEAPQNQSKVTPSDSQDKDKEKQQSRKRKEESTLHQFKVDTDGKVVKKTRLLL